MIRVVSNLFFRSRVVGPEIQKRKVRRGGSLFRDRRSSAETVEINDRQMGKMSVK